MSYLGYHECYYLFANNCGHTHGIAVLSVNSYQEAYDKAKANYEKSYFFSRKVLWDVKRAAG